MGHGNGVIVFFFKPFNDLRLIPLCYFDYFLQSHSTLVPLPFIFIRLGWNYYYYWL